MLQRYFIIRGVIYIKKAVFFSSLFLFIVAVLIVVIVLIPKHPNEAAIFDKMITQLESKGLTVEIKDESKSILAGERKWLTINQTENISIYFYESNEKMEEDAGHVSVDGCSYDKWNKKVEISWASYPHFYKAENVIALYVGEDIEIIKNLEQIFGSQFAGYSPN